DNKVYSFEEIEARGPTKVNVPITHGGVDKSRAPLVYISGPMYGLPDLNKPAFDEAERKFQALGYLTFNPASFPPDEEEAVYVARDLNVLRQMIAGVDMIALLPGWSKSRGAQAEERIAYWRGLDAVRMPGLSTGLLVPADPSEVTTRPRPDYGTVGTLTATEAGMRPADLAASTRTFATGATRDTDQDKIDPEGFLSPLVIQEFCRYMHKHRHQADGRLRASDNWQKGIPRDVYMKSLWRHFLELCLLHRGGYDAGEPLRDTLAALLFNTQGYLFEVLNGR
ncbi:MAG TPA: DUF4406 domain-containing protein, partial [Streptosporangiaceae bacterium]